MKMYYLHGGTRFADTVGNGLRIQGLLWPGYGS